MAEELRDRGIQVDGVLHGVFQEKDFEPGPKTVDDIWALIPFENYVVTAELTPNEIKIMMEDVYGSREPRSLIGFDVQTEGSSAGRRIALIRLADGRPLDLERRYRIALNSFDSRSGGHRFMKLRALLEQPASNCTLHAVMTRDAVIDYFQRHGVVHKIARPRRPVATQFSSHYG